MRARAVVLTADDFGLDEAVNEAVERAHRHGVLGSASLMVGEAAAADAVRRARGLPGLSVGLHLTLVDGWPSAPPDAVPDLLGPDGRFRPDMARAGFRFFLLPHVRRQLETEIRAQFAAFAATGLRLGHADAHKHFHLHPTVATMMLRIGREYGLRAVRLPREPGGVGAGGMGAAAMRLWCGQLAWQLRRAGMAHADRVFGLGWTGGMTLPRLLALVPRLPPGVSELYFHPASARTAALARAMPGYQHVEEMQALLAPELRAALDAAGIARTSLAALAGF